MCETSRGRLHGTFLSHAKPPQVLPSLHHERFAGLALGRRLTPVTYQHQPTPITVTTDHLQSHVTAAVLGSTGRAIKPHRPAALRPLIRVKTVTPNGFLGLMTLFMFWPFWPKNPLCPGPRFVAARGGALAHRFTDDTVCWDRRKVLPGEPGSACRRGGAGGLFSGKGA